jgi:hypothetical protein
VRKRTLLTVALLATLVAGSYGWCTGSASLRAIRVHAMSFAAQDQQNPKTVTVPAGTRILVRTSESIDSAEQSTGYRFIATLESNLRVGDVVVARRGATVHGQLVSASSAGRFAGSST